MYFNRIRRNASRSRKNNGLFFGSLVIAIIAFYTLLSLGDQDVMLFLKTIESDAVNKLMLLIPIVYVVSLFFVFFLVFFAYKYQLDNRKREFGLYLMLGMKRSRLFLMLMGETVWNSLMSLLIGLPIALFLTEAISLATSKLVGLGIINHRISFSVSAVLGTVIGFVVVQLITMVILSSCICRREPVMLLKSDTVVKQKVVSVKKGAVVFVMGLILLVCAYIIGINKLRTFNFSIVFVVIILGSIGTFLFYKGISSLIGYLIQKKSPKRTGLFSFTGRQIQENVFHEYMSMAISSLLLMMAISCICFGIGISANHNLTDSKTTDFSIMGSQDEVKEFIDSNENSSLIELSYPMYMGSMYDKGFEVSWSGLINQINNLAESEQRDNILENLLTRTTPYLIKLTSYNQLLQGIGKKPITLDENEAAIYTSMRDSGEFTNILSSALTAGSYFETAGQKIELLPEVYCDNIVADRSITIYLALIVRDEDYDNWTDNNNVIFCWNILLDQNIIKDNGLIQAIQMLKTNLDKTNLEYESYINGIGRNLFYIIAASYITIYLGVLFMIIANTVIGLKHLMQQRATRHRYITLLKLGAGIEQLNLSVKKQIRMFFLLVLSLAACNSLFAVWTLFTSVMSLSFQITTGQIIALCGIAFALLVVIEIIYIYTVERTGRGEIAKLQAADKGVGKLE